MRWLDYGHVAAALIVGNESRLADAGRNELGCVPEKVCPGLEPIGERRFSEKEMRRQNK
jgi:hypothetical protein